MIFPNGLRDLGLNVEIQSDYFPEDTEDTTILEECGRRGWVYVSQDRAIRKNPAELQALKSAGIHAIFMHGANRTAIWTVENFQRSLGRINAALVGAKGPLQILVTSDRIQVLGDSEATGPE